jgi:hypothetical protein
MRHQVPIYNIFSCVEQPCFLFFFFLLCSEFCAVLCTSELFLIDSHFFSGDREHMSLPRDASIVHAEFIYYYYPNDIPFPRK